MFPLNWKFLRVSCLENVTGTGRMDRRMSRRTDGLGATLDAASWGRPHDNHYSVNSVFSVSGCIELKITDSAD